MILSGNFPDNVDKKQVWAVAAAIRKILMALVLSFALPAMEAWAQYDTNVFFFRGRQAIMDGKYASAIENFNILASLDSTNYMTYFFRGIAKYNLGDVRGAHSDFNTSVRLNPVFTSGYHYRAITSSRAGNYEAALNDFEKAIGLRPGFTGLYFSRGVTYFLSQQFDKAVNDFNRYIRKEPKDPSAYLNRGACYLFLKDTVRALDDYNKAIKLDRFDPEGYVRRGRVYASQGKYGQAISDLDRAISLDTSNTFAYFNRAIMHYEMQDYISAMADLDRVLKDEPGNALTLYNRGLINAQVGEYEAALADMDRVLNINPENVLAYFNRASVFIELGRYQDALEDYDRAIALYPDFAKAYMNRAYVKNLLGDYASSKKDYDTAQAKVQEYRKKNVSGEASFADTTRKYNALLALDADFAQKDFNDELLQHRDIDVRLKPLYRFVLAERKPDIQYALERRYENPLLRSFIDAAPVGMALTGSDTLNADDSLISAAERQLYGTADAGAMNSFGRALYETCTRQFNSALSYYDRALDTSGNSGLGRYYKSFYYMNRAVLRAQMIEFISSIESNVQVLTMDDSGNTRARVRDQITHQYDYSEAISDMKAAVDIVGDMPYFWFNLGNLYCLASEHINSIDSYTKAIDLYPYMGDAYFNRGLVLIYLKDREKGCIDLSRAGELGVAEAYSVINKYCEEDN